MEVTRQGGKISCVGSDVHANYGSPDRRTLVESTRRKKKHLAERRTRRLPIRDGMRGPLSVGVLVPIVIKYIPFRLLRRIISVQEKHVMRIKSKNAEVWISTWISKEHVGGTVAEYQYRTDQTRRRVCHRTIRWNVGPCTHAFFMVGTVPEISCCALCPTPYLKKNLNAPRPSEHPPVWGKKCQNV